MHGERDGNTVQLLHHKHWKERKCRNSVVKSEHSGSKSLEYHGSHRGRSNNIRNVGMSNGSANVVQNSFHIARSESRSRKDHRSHRTECISIQDDAKSIPPSHTAPSMFNRSNNVTINGGSFQVTNANPVYDRRARGLKLLTKRVANTAFHNSAQRIDPPRCHPKTREDVLETMFEWIMSSKHREEWILWLNGAAGAGKSAIMQTLAERCVAAFIAVASFFFFKSDSTRNSIGPLVATLVYQLIQNIPEVSDDILHIIEENPLILDQVIESQLQQLIIQPYLRLPAHLRRPFVVFIDGLDECIDHIEQAALIKVFGDIARKCDASIVFVIASRREHQIKAAFGKEHVTRVLRTIPLDELSLAQTSSEIRLYLTDKFDEIKKTHPRKQDLPPYWPHKSSIDGIVEKSSGQFIYASVVMNFVSTPHTLPSTQLSIIENIRLRDPEENPFANLDALYQYIFSKVKHLDIVKSILAMVLTKWDDTFTPHLPTKIKEFEVLFSLQAGDVESLLANLSAVVHCVRYSTTEIKFLHASLGDFLIDQSRSGKFYIDLEECRQQLLCIFFESRIPYYEKLAIWWIRAIAQLLINAEATARLQHSILSFEILINGPCWTLVYKSAEILYLLRNLDFGDRGQAYHHVLNISATYFSKTDPTTVNNHYDDTFPEELVTRIKKINPAIEIPEGLRKERRARAISIYGRLKREAKYLLDYCK
ncbi:hypothetical protein BDN70DRAFT_996528 [Pholiota conissans]|uniref:Nephrocystin 3-like N-terminal domain-containing protein n=1 Tax=Pholiota conissans TaxID=109636 RepID=A0A9P5YUD5_9AGAR|nr:hypothetical protein BDN70DRAFT_996528 [Pholiota conissans]